MALNPEGMETLRLMLRVLAGDVKTIDDVPEEKRYHFKANPRDIKPVAVDYLANIIALGPDEAERRKSSALARICPVAFA